MKYYYDLHIHSALSPCADDDMTPNNIAGMASLKRLDFIAVTDHNSTANVQAAALAAGQYNINVIPGMELTTSEEIHILCLFYDESYMAFSEYVEANRMRMRNKPHIFGHQYIIDKDDNITGEVEDLLIPATGISVNDIGNIVKRYNGIAIPAHINKDSNSLYSVLGNTDWQGRTVELQKKSAVKLELIKNNVIINSDAHSLENISERENYIELEEKTNKALLDYLAGLAG